MEDVLGREDRERSDEEEEDRRAEDGNGAEGGAGNGSDSEALFARRVADLAIVVYRLGDEGGPEEEGEALDAVRGVSVSSRFWAHWLAYLDHIDDMVMAGSLRLVL